MFRCSATRMMGSGWARKAERTRKAGEGSTGIVSGKSGGCGALSILQQPQDHVHCLAGRNHLDIFEGFQIKEVSVSGKDQGGFVFHCKGEKQIVERICLDNGSHRCRIRCERDKIEEICQGLFRRCLEHRKPVRELAVL